MKISSTKLGISNETSMEGIKAVFCEKLEFESRVKSKLIAFCLYFLDDYELDKCLQTNVFLIKFSSTCVMFSILDMMEEIEPVVAEKN